MHPFFVPNFHAPIRKVHCFNFKIVGENFGYTNIFSLRKSLLANVKTICTLGTAGLLSASKYSPQYRRPRVSGVGHNSRSMEITRSFFRGGCQRVKWGEKWETERLRRHFVRKARGAREKGMRSAFAQVTTRFSLHLSRSSPFPVSFFFYFRVAVLPQTYRDDKKGHLRNHFYAIRKSGIDDEAPFDFARTHLLSFHPPRPTIIPGAIYWTSRGIPIRYLRVLCPKLISYYISFCTPSLL